MNIITLLVTVIFGIIGVGSTIAIVALLFVTLFQKIARKIKHGGSLYD